MAKAKKKLSLKRAVNELTALAEKRLASLPEKGQHARVAAFARRDFKNGRPRESGLRIRASDNDA